MIPVAADRSASSIPRRVVTEAGSGGHIVALDAVRGIAILLVLLFHFSGYDGLPPPNILPDRLVEMIAGIGWIGVDLFFVLSGFLITGILYDAKGTQHYFRNFYARRVLRIFPLYYVSLIIFVVVLPRLSPEDPGLRSLQNDGFWYWTYLTNVRIAHVGFPWFGALGHFWSLAIEEQFYLIWPAVILLFRRSSLIWICLLCICGSFILRVSLMWAGYGTAAYVLMPARMDALAAGASLALFARGPGGLAAIARVAPTATGLLGAVLVAIFVWRQGLLPWDPVMKIAGHTLLAALFAAVLVLGLTASDQTVCGRICASRTLCFFGRYSYGLYVFHHPILFFNLAGFLFLDHVPLVYGSLLLRKLVFVASAMTLSIIMALISWHLYEKHCLKLKRLFTDRSSASAAPSRFPGVAAAVPSQAPGGMSE
jgi:peptidoglycan/LPS O-acetylase OafA/YrhL